MMTQGPQQPPLEPQGQDAQTQPAPPHAAPQQPPAPQWGQYAQPGYPAPAQQYPGQLYGQPGFNHYVAPPKPGVIPLRPLGLGEILDGAFQAARRNGKAMFGSALIFQLATTAITLLVMYLAFGQAFGELMTMDPDVAADSESLESLGGSLVSFSVSLILTSLLAVAIQMILQGALVIPVIRAVLNRKTTFGQMWRLVKPRIGSLVVLSLVYAGAVAVVLGLYIIIVVLLVVGMDASSSGGSALAVIGLALLIGLPFLLVSVWIGTKILLAPAAIVVEQVGPLVAIKRSWLLTRSNWWRTFGISLLAGVIATVISSVITTPVSILASFLVPLMFGTEPSPEQAANAALIAQGIAGLIGALVGAVTLAFQTGVMALIYVDLRMRRDGFDIELLKETEAGQDDGGIPGSPVKQTGHYGQ